MSAGRAESDAERGERAATNDSPRGSEPARRGSADASTASAAVATVVRRATFGDLPIVVELRLALLRENGDHAVYGQLRPDARDRAYEVFGSQLRAPNEAMFLAERGGEIVGILRCVDTPNSPLLYPDRYCYVSSVYVRPRTRRSGVLKALLRRAAEWCVERDIAEMRLHNVPKSVASKAWEALGFRVMEEVRRKTLVK
jgi:ribosomal protein S18 acetylase RimI-like enzyme